MDTVTMAEMRRFYAECCDTATAANLFGSRHTFDCTMAQKTVAFSIGGTAITATIIGAGYVTQIIAYR